jgi:hypothetical protein
MQVSHIFKQNFKFHNGGYKHQNTTSITLFTFVPVGRELAGARTDIHLVRMTKKDIQAFIKDMVEIDGDKCKEVFKLDQAELAKPMPYQEEADAQRVKFEPIPCPHGQYQEGEPMERFRDPEGLLCDVLSAMPSYEAGRYSLDNDWQLFRLKDVLGSTGPYQLVPVSRKFSFSLLGCLMVRI